MTYQGGQVAPTGLPSAGDELPWLPVHTTLDDRQYSLAQSLAVFDEALAKMYVGALQVLKSTNVDAMPMAAYAIRELMDHLPDHVNLPKKSENVLTMIQELQVEWEDKVATSACRCGGDWRGTIDAPLQSLLMRLESFFVWRSQNHRSNRERTVETLRRLEPSTVELLPEHLGGWVSKVV